MDKRLVVAIDSWPSDSTHPLGHYVRTLGTIGEKDTETVGRKGTSARGRGWRVCAGIAAVFMCVRLCVSARMHVCVHVCMCMCVHAWVCACLCVSV